MVRHPDCGTGQGTGSVKRDCNIWEEFLKDCKIPYEAVPPCRNVTKTTAASFARITKWKGRTSEHSRDAAMLVWNRTPIGAFSNRLSSITEKPKRKKRPYEALKDLRTGKHTRKPTKTPQRA